MSNQPTQQLVASPRRGDVQDTDSPDLINDDLPCHCGYNLRGVPDTGKCPECGRDVAVILGDIEQAELDGRARRRLGASLLIANHLAWLCMLTPWYTGIRDDLRAVLVLLAAAGPRSVTSIEMFRPETVRPFATSVSLLFLLHIAGVWMLTTIRPRENQPARLRDAGSVLRGVQLLTVALAAWLFIARGSTDHWLLFWLNVLELPAGVLLGVYLARLGAAERRPVVVVGGRATAGLLGVSSVVLAVSALLWWQPDVSPRPWLYVALSAGAAAGLLLLVMLLYIRKMYRPDVGDV